MAIFRQRRQRFDDRFASRLLITTATRRDVGCDRVRPRPVVRRTTSYHGPWYDVRRAGYDVVYIDFVDTHMQCVDTIDVADIRPSYDGRYAAR